MSQEKKEPSIFNNWKMMLLLSLTLGLAPFTPPHIVGKLKWVAGGAHGMQLMDWLDIVFHGTPWVLLFRALFITFVKKADNQVEP